jgi:hypothetical protein
MTITANQIKTPADLRMAVESVGSVFFCADNMKLNGDTMRNYGLRRTTLKTHSGEIIEALELYRKQPVKHGLSASAFFCPITFRRRFGTVA